MFAPQLFLDDTKVKNFTTCFKGNNVTFGVANARFEPRALR